mgnify:CR=1 FL=1
MIFKHNIQDKELFQRIIPIGLSLKRYISGIPALNLPAPEGTSGDWHFWGAFFHRKKAPEMIFLAGEGEAVNTNPILASYGIYRCDEVLARRGLKFKGPAFAANHFRAILDILYQILQEGRAPTYLYCASEDFLDSKEEKEHLLQQASLMLPYLDNKQQTYLLQWVAHEQKDGYRS